jgi:DNA-directed RNA polymerase specialized sigma24 family protein
VTRRRRAVTPEGRDALAEARAVTDQVRDARSLMAGLAAARRAAVLRANRGGASYGVIAAELGISHASAQQLVNAGKAQEGEDH